MDTQKPERTGICQFDGPIIASNAVLNELSLVMVFILVDILQTLARRDNGLDYLQIFESDDGRKIYAIDQAGTIKKTIVHLRAIMSRYYLIGSIKM